MAGAIALGVTLAAAIGACVLIIASSCRTACRHPSRGDPRLDASSRRKALHEHVEAVADALENGGLGPGRASVAEIVGRDPARSTRRAWRAPRSRASPRISPTASSRPPSGPRALRPAGRGCLQGGEHRRQHDRPSHATARRLRLRGGAFRRLVNLPASRLSALPGSPSRRSPCRTPHPPKRCAPRCATRSATARPTPAGPRPRWRARSALKLAGPRVYDGVTVEDAFMGDGRRVATERDIRRALRLYRAACAIQIAVYALLRRAPHRASAEETIEVEMRAQMRGELIERLFDIGLIGNARGSTPRSRRAAPRAGADRKRARAHTPP